MPENNDFKIYDVPDTLWDINIEGDVTIEKAIQALTNLEWKLAKVSTHAPHPRIDYTRENGDSISLYRYDGKLTLFEWDGKTEITIDEASQTVGVEKFWVVTELIDTEEFNNITSKFNNLIEEYQQIEQQKRIDTQREKINQNSTSMEISDQEELDDLDNQLAQI